MKKIILFITMMMFYIEYGHSQITILDSNFKSSINKLVEKPIIFRYDSLSNYFNLEYTPDYDKDFYAQQIIGQRVYCSKDDYCIGLKISQELLKHIESDSLYKIINFDDIRCLKSSEMFLKKGYYTVSNVEIYDQSSPENKIFERLREIARNQMGGDRNCNTYKTNCLVYNTHRSGAPGISRLVELVDEKGDTYYVRFPDDTEFGMGTMIFVGYFEKIKQLWLDKTIYITGNNEYTEKKTIDLVTKEEIILKTTSLEEYKNGKGHPFKCTSVSIYEDVNALKNSDRMIVVAVLEDSDSKFVVEARYLRYFDYHCIFTPKEFYDKELDNKALNAQPVNKIDLKEQQRKNQIIQKYGKVKGENVLKERITIGMTKSMCKDAWGLPLYTRKQITTKGTNEIWIYNFKTKLIFENDILIQIDN